MSASACVLWWSPSLEGAETESGGERAHEPAVLDDDVPGDVERRDSGPGTLSAIGSSDAAIA